MDTLEIGSGKIGNATETGQEAKSIAVVGASGFIGLRVIEILSEDAKWIVRPIVRGVSSLAVIARQHAAWHIADLLSPDALASALTGCSVCVHSAIGDAAQIVQMAKATYRACALAGVKRLIWLSSASVHGQNPALDTTEKTPLRDNHALIYNNAKVRAEWALERLSGDGKVEVVRIRPGVVFGPRSRWITVAADTLRMGHAAWINQGQGICNSLYVDNLVEAIRLSALCPGIGGQAFLVGDDEKVTWRDFLIPIAEHIGFNEASYIDVEIPLLIPERQDLLTALTFSHFYSAFGRKIPDRAKRIAKSLFKAWKMPLPTESAWRLRKPPAARLTVEMALLQQCAWSLPNTKAVEMLGYLPPVRFSEGLRRSLAWLDFLK